MPNISEASPMSVMTNWPISWLLRAFNSGVSPPRKKVVYVHGQNDEVACRTVVDTSHGSDAVAVNAMSLSESSMVLNQLRGL